MGGNLRSFDPEFVMSNVNTEKLPAKRNHFCISKVITVEVRSPRAGAYGD